MAHFISSVLIVLNASICLLVRHGEIQHFGYRKWGNSFPINNSIVHE